MAKVLIAEDELIYREYLAAALDAEGHEVKSCLDGRDAIKIGSYFRPDVLVADWMLKSHIHGLHVSRVLRHLNPQQKTILITGFPSADLMLEAETDSVFAFIRKPFDLGELKDKVALAARKEPTESFQSDLGFLEIDDEKRILYANQRAQMFLPALASSGFPSDLNILPENVHKAFGEEQLPGWFELAGGAGGQVIHAYPLRYSDKLGCLFILLSQEHSFYKQSKLIELLISSHAREAVQHFWPFEGRILILDSNPSLRRMAIDLFDGAGALCHSTDSFNSTIKIIERDVGVRHIIIDYEMPDRLSFAGGLGRFVELVRAKLPNVTIIGQSERNHAKEFNAVGVPFFVQKPWTLEQLIDTITGH